MPRKSKNDNSSAKGGIPPETEVNLKKLQEEYLKDKSNVKVFQEFFSLIRVYARSLVLKQIKRKGLYLQPEKVDEISTDATIKIVDQYKEDGWMIKTSFGGALYFKILEAMYEYSNEEKMAKTSLNFKLNGEDSEESKELGDILGNTTCLPWDMTKTFSTENFSESPEEYLANMISTSYSEVERIIDFAFENLPYNSFLRFIPWLVLQFRKTKTRNGQASFNKIFLSNEEENAFDLLFLEIFNRIKDNI